VVVDGRVHDSDGKTEDSRRTISLDQFTVAALRDHIGMLDRERSAFGPSYPHHGKLMVFEDGRRLHPDTITSRFNHLVDLAGVRRIRLHDVRHTYATLALYQLRPGRQREDRDRPTRSRQRDRHAADLHAQVDWPRSARRGNDRGTDHRSAEQAPLRGFLLQFLLHEHENGPSRMLLEGRFAW
jgi:integrase